MPVELGWTPVKEGFYETIGYKPHPKQLEFHSSEARFKIWVAGRRTGKSYATAMEVMPYLFEPNKRVWIVGPTYDLGEKEFRVIWEVIVKQLGLGTKQVKKAYNKDSGSMYIEFLEWGTRLEVRSADHPQNLVGEALDFVVLAEAAKIKDEVWKLYLRPALADKRGAAIISTTPQGHNWVYDVWQLGQDPEETEYESWQCPTWENTAMFPGGENDPEIKLIKRTTSPDFFAQEIRASFTSFVGQVYSEFDKDLHVKPHVYDESLPNYQFWDFGFVNAMCVLDVQITPQDEVIIWRELYEQGLRIDDMVERMMRREDPEGYRVNCAFGDAADPEGIMVVNRLWSPCYGENEAKVNWRQGVEAVKRFLAERLPADYVEETVQECPDDCDYGEECVVHLRWVDDWHDPDGTPTYERKFGLWVDPSCVNTIWEFQNYRVATPGQKALGDAMEKPTKKDDHAMDALRYGIMHLFELGASMRLSKVNPLGRRGTPDIPRVVHALAHDEEELESMMRSSMMRTNPRSGGTFFNRFQEF